jgi:hypothetical protein
MKMVKGRLKVVAAFLHEKLHWRLTEKRSLKTLCGVNNNVENNYVENHNKDNNNVENKNDKNKSVKK